MDNWDAEELELIPETQNTNTGLLSAIIDNSLSRRLEEGRNYIGASSIGSPCERKIWYSFTGVQGDSIAPSMRRTFDIGKRLELMILDYLTEAGLDIIRQDNLLGYASKNVRELQGHVDGIWLRPWPDEQAIIEIKTAKDSSFRVFQKAGLLKWYPVYYAQVQAYMGMSGIKTTFVIAINKDTSELHDEFVNFDPDYYRELEFKAARISESLIAPEKINNSPLYFVCRTCQYKGTCHESK